jgi:protein MpaA
MLIGSLHGNEPLAVTLIERLAEDARDHSDRWNGRTVLFVRTPNPDGMARGTRANSRGVDLNRNFPTRNFRANRQHRTGPRPGSEVETTAILRLLYAFRPARVVHVKSTTDETGWVLYSHSCGTVVRKFSGPAGLRLQQLPPGAIPGSLESYVTDVLATEQITIAVPAATDADAAWQEYGDVLLTAVGATGPSHRNEQAPAPPVAENQRSTARDLAANKNRETTGGEPETEDIPVPAKGYFELPPPPQDSWGDGT